MNGENTVSQVESLTEEISRLKEKCEAVSDPEIREAINWKIASLESKLGKLEAEPATEQEPESEVIPPTPAQLVEADNLIRQARVEKMRGNKARSIELLKNAVTAAPTAPSVLEALGDDFVERRQLREARETYAKALKLDPKNVGLETKYANVVLGTSMSMSVEEQLRLGMSDSLFLTSQDHVASASAATLLSVMLPGLGHLVLGRTATGLAILVSWVACGFWLLFLEKDVKTLAQSVMHGGGTFNPVVFVPIIIMAILFVGTINSLRVPKAGARGRSNRPVPPVDLPY